MSDNDDDLFADSDDTAELIGSTPAPTKKVTKKAAPKRKRNDSAKKNIPDADDNADSDDDDDDKGLFDSDDSDDDDGAKKPAAKKVKKSAAATKKPLSKKERMDLLQKKKRAASGIVENRPVVDGVPSEKKKKEGGDDDGDSYNSGEFQLNEDDRNFIDTEGDDADALNELYSEQHFDDARGEAEEDSGYGKKGRKGGGSRGGGGRKSDTLDPDADPDNPIMAAVSRMKKKKREPKKLTELEEDSKEFMDKMERAAEEDELAVRERRPALKKLQMLNTVVTEFTKRDITRVLLDLDVLSICKRWIAPLHNGQLGNVTVRSKILDSIANMTGEMGITPGDLKRSQFGKVVMSLYMHKSETPAMKRKLKSLIEQWSRPIFQKSGNMRDLERVHHGRGEAGIAGISRQQRHEKGRQEAAAKGPAVRGGRKNVSSLIKSGKAKGADSGLNRVRVPYSTGFQYSVRPASRIEAKPDKGAGGETAARGALSKRMVEKGRAVAKNQRSANISVEGRATKG